MLSSRVNFAIGIIMMMLPSLLFLSWTESNQSRRCTRALVATLFAFILLKTQPATSFSVAPKNGRSIAIGDESRSFDSVLIITTPTGGVAIDDNYPDSLRHDGICRQIQVGSRRRQLMLSVGAAAVLPLFAPFLSSAAETVGKDPACNDATCLGVWDGLLADCPHKSNVMSFSSSVGCASSQDDTPGNFAEPWDYSEIGTAISSGWQREMDRLVDTIQLVSASRGDQFAIQLREGRYLRGTFTDAQGQQASVGEFYFTPDDTTVQFRIAAVESSGTGRPSILASPSIRNLDRAELIRKAMGYLKLPVLRNRRRTLFFVESDLDTFGPGSAALGPPAEMKTGELEGRIYVP